MKNLFNINLKCPFCGKVITYNMLTFKAKYECEHCENELLIRMKPIISAIISIIGFFILLGIAETFGITEMGTFIRFLFVIVGCIIYLVITYPLLCLVLGANKIYVVDALDPTMLERYRKMKK